MSRNSAYQAASRGDIPTLNIGRKKIVPVPRLVLMLDPPEPDENNTRIAETLSVLQRTLKQVEAENADLKRKLKAAREALSS